jgi:hypothetical protein
MYQSLNHHHHPYSEFPGVNATTDASQGSPAAAADKKRKKSTDRYDQSDFEEYVEEDLGGVNTS